MFYIKIIHIIVIQYLQYPIYARYYSPKYYSKWIKMQNNWDDYFCEKYSPYPTVGFPIPNMLYLGEFSLKAESTILLPKNHSRILNSNCIAITPEVLTIPDNHKIRVSYNFRFLQKDIYSFNYLHNNHFATSDCVLCIYDKRGQLMLIFQAGGYYTKYRMTTVLSIHIYSAQPYRFTKHMTRPLKDIVWWHLRGCYREVNPLHGFLI